MNDSQSKLKNWRKKLAIKGKCLTNVNQTTVWTKSIYNGYIIKQETLYQTLNSCKNTHDIVIVAHDKKGPR